MGRRVWVGGMYAWERALWFEGPRMFKMEQMTSNVAVFREFGNSHYEMPLAAQNPGTSYRCRISLKPC